MHIAPLHSACGLCETGRLLSDNAIELIRTRPHHPFRRSWLRRFIGRACASSASVPRVERARTPMWNF
eukprot:scaffold130207_cov32-Tisochrysis_lutea.AAC.4